MSKRTPLLYLTDILDSVNKILKYTKGLSFEQFSADELKIDAVVRNFQIIGEAAKNISDKFDDKFPEVSWHEIVGMRNKIIHEYSSVDEEIIWKNIKEELPILKKQVKKILDSWS